MISAIMMNGTGYGGARIHNGATENESFGRGTPNSQGLSPLSSACLYLRMQSSTPCDILAKSLDSTFFSRYSINSGGNVTVMYGFRAIYDKILQCLINSRNVVSYSVRQNLTGVPQHDRIQPISGSYAGHPDHNEVRGPVRGGEDAADRISGAIRPGDAAEPLHPQAGAGVRVADADRRVPRGIIPVRGGSGAIGDGREAMA